MDEESRTTYKNEWHENFPNLKPKHFGSSSKLSLIKHFQKMFSFILLSCCWYKFIKKFGLGKGMSNQFLQHSWFQINLIVNSHTQWSFFSTDMYYSVDGVAHSDIIQWIQSSSKNIVKSINAVASKIQNMILTNETFCFGPYFSVFS